MTPNIKFLRVKGIRSVDPYVLAFVNNTRVRWNVKGWDCVCPEWAAGTTDDDTCPHVEAIAELLDPRVTGENE